MIEKCAICNEKIEILPIQESIPSNTAMTTAGTFTYTTTGMEYPSALTTYKCSNPKCWVTKITESWE